MKLPCLLDQLPNRRCSSRWVRERAEAFAYAHVHRAELSDPRSGETDVSIFRSSAGFNAAEPNPRVRLVRADGVVLLDEIATRTASEPWRVLFRTYLATLSTGLFAALREGSLLLEIWAVDSGGPGTRVALVIVEAGVSPIGRCV